MAEHLLSYAGWIRLNGTLSILRLYRALPRRKTFLCF